ncbi:MAG TPA: cytochrome c, partial [Novosphingobium sp.]|nr:cytochrome c [Novosphingobium sp.]
GRYCAVCHGDAAIGGTLNPDLRRSVYINAPDGIRTVVIDGVLMQGEHPKGMVSFKSALRPEDVEDIRQYLIKRANEDKALGDK